MVNVTAHLESPSGAAGLNVTAELSPSVAHAAALTADEARSLMLGFCSLGWNCEFGAAQRGWGAEPLDFFAWAQARTPLLLSLLRAQFKDVGNPDLIKIAPSRDEYSGVHVKYDFKWHTLVKVKLGTIDEILAKESKRLPFLARKCMNDLAEGTRIFVVKEMFLMPEPAAREVLKAMHEYGRATLMYVNEGPLGVIREDTYLLRATIPKMADSGNVIPTTPLKDWLELCRQARALMA